MARTYKRDSRGRFASGGGGGGGSKKASKPPSTRAQNKATTQRLMDKGLVGTGSRLRNRTAALYSGTKATKSKFGKSWTATESDQRVGAYGVAKGAQRSKSRVKGTVKRR